MTATESKLGTSCARARGHVRLDRRRIRDFHHLRCSLSLLCRQKCNRPATEGCARCAHLLQRLFAFQQSDHSLRRQGSPCRKSQGFSSWWSATILLGAAFLFGTASEWRRLIYQDGLTISTNLFGTTYYSLVGLHGFHVIVGLLLLSLVMAFTMLGRVGQEQAYRVDVLSLYWHFVDAIWVVVFTVVYVIGR